MRQVCPHCYTNNEVAEELAGKEATCSYCAKTFPVPGRYTAQVSAAASAAVAGVIEPVRTSPLPEPAVAPPPVPVAPPEPPPGFQPTVDGFVPAVDGTVKEIGFSVPPKLVAWLPAIMLTLVFLLTFFPWVASYRGNSTVYSQRPWGALVGGTPARNFKLEDAGIPGGWLDKVRSDWKLLLPFFLLLIVGFAFAWAERGLKSFDPRKVPPLVKLWPWRNFIIGMCAFLSLLFLIGQLLNGFGMERALRAQVATEVAARFEPELAKAGDSPALKEKVEYTIEQELRKYDLEHTTWACLALTFLVLASLAALLRPCLDARGDKPAPRFDHLPPGGFFAVEPQREALRAAAGLQELVQLHLNRLVPGPRQRLAHARALRVVNDGLSHHHRIAPEPVRLRFLHRDQFRDVRVQHALPVGVERVREVQRFARRERAEARIEVVEPRVHQLERQYADAQFFTDPLVRTRVRPRAVAGEQRVAAEQRVARAFMERVFRQVLHGETVRGEPRVEVRRLFRAHLVAKPAAEEPGVEHQTGVRGEHEVR